MEDDPLVRIEDEARTRRERRPRDGDVERAVHVPAGVRLRRAHVEHRRGADLVELLERRRRTEERPLFSATTRAVVGGRGVDTAAELVMNSCTSPKASATFVLFSAPIVDERAGLIAAPHSEPATCPG